MRWRKKDHVRIHLPRAAIDHIFDECDRFDADETGGRLVGTFEEHGHNLTLHVTGVIEAGPNARRSPTSLFQDGPHQESVFRKLEEQHPELEHLGTWHTHHVNGLQTLSGGDLGTYQRTVNHGNHNTNFFYALLVTTKNDAGKGKDRYHVKHFVFLRGKDYFVEVPQPDVSIEDSGLIWPGASVTPVENERSKTIGSLGRISDRDVLSEFFPSFRPYRSPKLGLYWRGDLSFADGSSAEVVVVEDPEGVNPKYTVAVRKPENELIEVAETLSKQVFVSARAALVETERSCNRAIVQNRAPKK